jgi:16S rRNA (guanine527-N7)-methyltransferase
MSRVTESDESLPDEAAPEEAYAGESPSGETPAELFPGDTLAAAIERYGLELTAAEVERIDAYCRLLWEWNEKVNLTRHTTYDKFVGRDLIDSRYLAAVLNENETVLDVGSGNGIPGVIIAILRPDAQVTLLDSVAKKMKVMEDIVGRLGISCRVVTARVEDHLRENRYDTLVARAVGPFEKMLRWLKPHWQRIGRLLAVKGPKWKEEVALAKHHGLMRELNLENLVSYPMPGLDSESVLLQLWHKRRQL